MSQLLILIAIASWVDFVSGTATLSLPTSANCGDQAVLTCSSTDCNLAYRFLKNGSTIYHNIGPLPGIDPDKYIGTVTSNSTVKLTIANIQLVDVGGYACACGFNTLSSLQTMQYICTASTSKATITNGKKLSITVDSLYPQPSKVVASLTRLSPGSYECGKSPTLALHYSCTWLSTTSLTDGNYSYTMTVTTGAQTASVTGSFRIVTPASPNISNLETISQNRHVLSCIQGTPLTIKCMSSGGIPAPTLAWYQGSTNTSPLVQSIPSDSVYQSDGTYQVTLNHTIIPSRTDDMTSLLCQVFYPGATSGASPDPTPAMALLFLKWKLGTVTVSQIGEAVSGGNMAIRCTSTHGRPAPSITWSFRGQSFTPTNTPSLDTTSETYTVVSVLQRPVSAVDNGQPAICRVTYTALSESPTATVIVDVKFGPSKGSATISGNHATAATGSIQIRLNCTSGSSNPASNITWYNESGVISNVVGNKKWSGDNNGEKSSNILIITPTRYMDGDIITCRTDNSYGSDSTYVDLDILYSPLIPPLQNITLIEGQPDVFLMCSASSKPPANFTWRKGQTVLANGMGTIKDNSFSYVISRVDRSDVGSYQCEAGNSVGSPDMKNVYLIVKYPPTVKVSSTTSRPYKVTCTAEGYPDDYTYQDWVQVWPGYGPVATIPFTETTLTLTDITYEMSGVYVCGASNAVTVYGTNVEFVKGNGTILIKAPPVLTDPSPGGTRVPVAGKLGQDATIEIKYWNNVDDAVVKCYKFMGGSRSAISSCSVTETDTEVTLPVHNHMVTETGKRAIIKIHISIWEDMTDYDLVVSNSEQGESVLGIIVVPQGPPEAPTLIGNFSITPGQVILTVVPGFHGGYNQTLVVQITTDLTTWINATSVYKGLDNRATDVILDSLRENTLYYVRLFAYSTVGGSNNFSTVMNFTTVKDPPTRSASAALIGGIVGTICALLVVAIVLVVLWRSKKAGRVFSKKADRRSLHKEQDNTDSVVECAMYVSAGNVQPETSKRAVYSTPQKRGRSDPSANVYAVVSKTKKGLPDISQMAETTFDTTKKTTSNLPLQSMINANDDGLIYADLEFDSNAKYDEIHGLDDVTIYVEIDFTKTAEPLPDSDEKSTEKKQM